MNHNHSANILEMLQKKLKFKIQSNAGLTLIKQKGEDDYINKVYLILTPLLLLPNCENTEKWTQGAHTAPPGYAVHPLYIEENSIPVLHPQRSVLKVTASKYLANTMKPETGQPGKRVGGKVRKKNQRPTSVSFTYA